MSIIAIVFFIVFHVETHFLWNGSMDFSGTNKKMPLLSGAFNVLLSVCLLQLSFFDSSDTEYYIKYYRDKAQNKSKQINI